MTAGHDCGPGKCAWSIYIEPFLRRARPAWNIRLVNVARGSWGAKQFADVPGGWTAATGAEIFIVDTTVNAQSDEDSAATMDRLLWRLLFEPAAHTAPLPPAVLYVQVRQTGSLALGGIACVSVLCARASVVVW